MRRFLIVLVAVVACLALALGITVPVVQGLSAGPVYSVAQVRAGLTHDPSAWVGRTVLVRGILTGCPSGGMCAHFIRCSLNGLCSMQPAPGIELVDSVTPGGAPSSTRGLALRWGTTDPLLGFLRGLPVIGTLAPKAQRVRWLKTTVYRVRLERGKNGSCASAPCYDAVLLDPSMSASAYSLLVWTNQPHVPNLGRIWVWAHIGHVAPPPSMPTIIAQPRPGISAPHILP